MSAEPENTGPTSEAPPTRRAFTEVRTLVFTDIVGSTRLKQILGDLDGAELVEKHHALLRALLRQFPDGFEVSNSGDGFLLVFSRPSEAVHFALRLQAELREFNYAAVQRVDDRIGIHTGEVVWDASNPLRPDVSGLQVDTAARVTSLASSDQILLTRFAFDNARQMLRASGFSRLGELAWQSHGHYLVQGVDDPLEVCEVGEMEKARLRAPTESPKARRHLQSDGEMVLGWRPAVGEKVRGTSWVLRRPLGEGGFGEVWLGAHEHTRQQRVFKYCFRADRARSLRREVTLFRLLTERLRDHPNIVRLGDVYLEEPPFYLSMEFVPGEDLLRWSQAQGGVAALPEEVKIELVAQVADALAAAHGVGVLHRDVKPSNILIDDTAPGRPQAKLTDFGIGQVVSQEVLQGLTGMGFTATVVPADGSSQSGTRLYMAPELIAGHGASPQSDVYSLGVVLYQLLIGDFNRPLAFDWARQIEDPHLRSDLELCFAGVPSERHTTAGDLAVRLRAIPERRRDRMAAEAAARQREREAYRRGVMRAAIAAAALVALFAGIAITAWRASQEATQNAEHAQNARREAESQRRIAEQRRAESDSLRLEAEKQKQVAEVQRQEAERQQQQAQRQQIAADDARHETEAALDFMLLDLRTKLEPSGQRQVLLQVVEKALALQHDADRRQPPTPRGKVREATALTLRGDIYLYRGEAPKARADYEASRRLLDEALAAEPDLDAGLRLQASIGFKLGDALVMLGDNKTAAAESAQSVQRYERLLARGQPDATLQRDAAMALWKNANQNAADSDPGAQEAVFRRVLDLRLAAVKADPSQPQWVCEVAQVEFSLAKTHFSANDPTVAFRELEQCRTRLKALLQQEPANAYWENNLALLARQEAAWRNELATHRRDAHASAKVIAETEAEARRLAEEAVSTLRSLAAREPGNLWWQIDLSDALLVLADCAGTSRSGSGDALRAEVEGIHQRLAAQYPNVPLIKGEDDRTAATTQPLAAKTTPPAKPAGVSTSRQSR